jgi:hypothetical protein
MSKLDREEILLNDLLGWQKLQSIVDSKPRTKGSLRKKKGVKLFSRNNKALLEAAWSQLQTCF